MVVSCYNHAVMKSVDRVLTLSLASTVHPKAEERRQWEIATFSPILKRPLALGLHRLAVQHPERVAKYLGIEFIPNDMAYVGAGGVSMVFKASETEVVKVYKDGLMKSKLQLRKFAEQQSQQHAAMAEFLGEFVLPQTTYVDDHPLIKGRQAVMTRQPYSPGITDAGIFGEQLSNRMPERVASLSDKFDTATHQLGEFAARSWDLYDKHRLVPDTIGDCNLVTASEDELKLLLIDGQPIVIGRDNASSRAVRSLEDLSNTLQAAA